MIRLLGSRVWRQRQARSHPRLEAGARRDYAGAMPLYFSHVRGGTVEADDEEGSELPESAAAAR